MFILVLLVIGYPKDNQHFKNEYSSLLDTVLIKKSYTIDDIDLILENTDLRTYHFKYEEDGYYRKIIRVKFLQNFTPITFELGMVDSGNYDLILKYGTGDRITFNKYPYVASEKKKLLFKNIQSNETKRLAISIFLEASVLPPPVSKPASCPFHVIEYRSAAENGGIYYKYEIWCQIENKKQLKIITDIYLLISAVLAEKKITILFLAQWEDMIVRWNNEKVKRFLTHKGNN